MTDAFELHSIITSWGVIRFEVAGDGLVRCSLPRLSGIPDDVFEILEVGSDPYSSYIRDLFAGRDPALPSIGRLSGTTFQVRVWHRLMKIPKGETRSYLQLAQDVGSPLAVRAVANACGRNPAPLFVPCHRVIRADGNIGGFASGLAWKRLLLAVEQLKQ